MRVTTFLAPCLLALTAAAGTWTVDDDGGPGVDFTDIQPAIDVASAGDRIRVLPGSYSGFVLAKPLVIHGAGTGLRFVDGPVLVSGSPAGSVTVVADLRLSAPGTAVTDPLLRVEGCAGTVVLDALTATTRHVRVVDSADVRMQDTTVQSLPSQFAGLTALVVDASRVEVSGCTLRGGGGADCFGCELGGPGGDAVWVSGAGGEVHAYRSTLQGGDGGDADVPFLGGTGFGGDGGEGLHAGGGAVLLAGQATHGATGGAGGQVSGGNGLGSPGSPGCGLRVPGAAQARASGVTLVQPFGGCVQGVLDEPAPADPTLHTLGLPTPGGALTFRVTAVPGSQVELNLGRFPALVQVGGLDEDILIHTVRTYPLGTVGPNGAASLNFTLPASLATGSFLFAQARVTLPGGETRYTNSAPLVMR